MQSHTRNPLSIAACFLLIASPVAYSAACLAPPPGLVSWWRGENNALDATSSNNATLRNGASFSTGAVGSGFNLDGVNDYLLVNASPNLNVGVGGGFTIEGWINPTTTAVQMPIFEFESVLGSFNGADVGVQFYISLPPGGGTGPGCFYANIKDVAGADHQVATGAGLVKSNTWQHVALSYNKPSGTVVIYLNGAVVLQANIGSFTPETSFNLLFGARTTFGSASNPSDKFSGKMDEFSVYNRALTVLEIHAIYAADGAGKCAPPTPPPGCTPPAFGLVSWWKAETNAMDSVDGNNGTAEGPLGFAAGQVGQAFFFGDTNADIMIPASANLNVGSTNGFTLEAWINPSDVTQRAPLFEWNNGAGWGVHFWIDPGSFSAGPGALYANIVDANGFWHQIHTASGAVTSNVFQHVALTYDKTTGEATIYCNGAVVARQALGGFTPLTTFDLYLGRRVSGAPGDLATFSGLMDEAAIYNRALSKTEIQSIFNASDAGKCAPPPPAVCTPVPTGAVSWWKAESNALDSVDGNNGILQNGVGFTAGKVGQAFDFNTSDSSVRVPASASLNVGTNVGFTVEGWINPAQVTGQYPIAEWNNGSGWGVHFYIDALSFGAGPGTLYANVVDSGGGWHQMHTAAEIATPNVFQHVALTYDNASGVATIYRNGAVVLQQNLGSFTPLTTFDLYLGRRPGGDAEFSFAGLLDEMSLYKRALTTNEIQAIYTAGSEGKCAPTPPPACTPTPTNVISWWKAENNALDNVATNHGIILSGVGFAPGKVGQGFSFATTNSAIRVPASPSLDVGTSDGLTIECWINPSDVAEQHSIAEWNTSGSWGAHFWIDPLSFGAGPGALYANIADTGGGWHQIQSASGAVTTNVFQHVALTYDKASGIARIYCNGVVVAESNFGSFTPLTTFDLNLGHRPTGGDPEASFAGILDEVTLSARALTTNEIQAIYNAGDKGKCGGSGSKANESVSQNILVGPAVTGSDFVVRFAGIPDLTYTIESASNLNGPWEKAVNVTAPSTDAGLGAGIFEFREPVGTNTARFYRTVYPSY